MIGVQRPAVPIPQGLLTEACVEQITTAAKLFSKKKNWGSKASLTRYSHQTVKDRLEDLFHGKCAYCESEYGIVGPMDVEHFRPKGGIMVEGKLEPPGYYWLAATWDNLLPSCNDCNRRRRQPMPDGTRVTAGKANQFPLANEALRKSRLKAKYWKEGAEAGEQRLLLNPCVDDPAQHLQIDRFGLVQSAIRNGTPSEQGAATIRVCALNRYKLRRARAERRASFESQIRATRAAARRLDNDPSNAVAQRDLSLELRDLRKYRSDEAPYLLMTRSVADEILHNFGGLLRRHRTTLGISSGRSNLDLVDAFIENHPPPEEPVTDGDLVALSVLR